MVEYTQSISFLPTYLDQDYNFIHVKQDDDRPAASRDHRLATEASHDAYFKTACDKSDCEKFYLLTAKGINGGVTSYIKYLDLNAKGSALKIDRVYEVLNLVNYVL